MAITFLTDEDKAELLSKINEAASSDDGMERVIVDVLPTTGIKVDTVYLVPNAESGVSNRYDEYIFIPNEGATAKDETYSETDGTWERFGGCSGNIDLTEVNNRIDELSKAIVELGGALTEPAEDDIPKVFFKGTAPQTKAEDELPLEMEYASKTLRFHDYVTLKV
jgi:hypothetical protein